MTLRTGESPCPTDVVAAVTQPGCAVSNAECYLDLRRRTEILPLPTQQQERGTAAGWAVLLTLRIVIVPFVELDDAGRCAVSAQVERDLLRSVDVAHR